MTTNPITASVIICYTALWACAKKCCRTKLGLLGLNKYLRYKWLYNYQDFEDIIEEEKVMKYIIV